MHVGNFVVFSVFSCDDIGMVVPVMNHESVVTMKH